MMKSKKEILNDDQELNGFKKILDAFILKKECIRHILTWGIITLLVNALIMYLNPLYLSDEVSSPFIHYLTRIILNSGVFISIGAVLFFFKNRNIYFTLYSILWIALGIVNNILMEVRNTPLTKYDFGMLSVGANVAKDFLNNSHYVKIGIFVVASILIVYIVAKKSKNSKKYSMENAIASWVYINILSAIFAGFILSSNSPHLNDYAEFGFVYGFKENLITPEFRKPYGYKDSTMQDIKNNIDKLYSVDKDSKRPNIVAVQLESFFDPKTVEGLKISENPIPYFDELRSKYTSGYLKVPTVGGGTARTEFEFITGVSLKNMTDGIIPHSSMLQKGPYISSVYAMKKSGYQSHLIHNFGGYFYDRDVVYNNLGFDTFTSLEFLANGSVDPNLIKASRDAVFPSEIKKALTSSEDRDFVFAITAQLHGNYESNYSEFEHGIKASNGFKENMQGQVNDYVNELKSIDNTIKDIIKTVEEVNEPTIVIFYSDHLPPLNYNGTNIKGDKKYEAPYVVWDNLGLQKDNANMSSFELLSKYMHIAGIEGNYMNKLQVTLNKDADYEKYQDLVQYDILYGKNYIDEKLLPYKVKTKLGSNDLRIDNAEKEGITYTFKGEGFTPMTTLVIDDNICGIEFVDDSTIKLSTNLDLTGKNVYAKIQVGGNENSVLKSNIYKVK